MDNIDNDSDSAPQTLGHSSTNGLHPDCRRTLDLIGMVALLGLAAGVYLVVGDAGFSTVIGAVVGLYGAWRTRQ